MRTCLAQMIIGSLASVLLGCSDDRRVMSLPLGDGVSIGVVRVPAGEFLMGSTSVEREGVAEYLRATGAAPEGIVAYLAKEAPAHKVAVTQPLYIGICEVTQRQFQAVMGRNPSSQKSPNGPVDMVSWDEANEFCRKVSTTTGRKVRLPSEAEWEYACRADSNTWWHFGNQVSDIVLYDWTERDEGPWSNTVGARRPNRWGLYDMHGNVREWCGDLFESARQNGDVRRGFSVDRCALGRAVRGGCYFGNPIACRSAVRREGIQDSRYEGTGFRIVIEEWLPAQKQ